MRSERELGLGPARGGGCGREKRPMEVPLRRESPRREPDTAPNPPPSPAPPLPPAPVKQRDEKKTALSKVRGGGLGMAGRGVGARNRRARGGVRLRALRRRGTVWGALLSPVPHRESGAADVLCAVCWAAGYRPAPVLEGTPRLRLQPQLPG